MLATRRNGNDDHISDSTLATMLQNLSEPRVDRAPVLTMPPFTPHDLRRTARSYMTERLGGDYLIAERCLGHAVGGRVFLTYDSGDYLPQRRALLEKWAAFVDRLVHGDAASVVFLPAKARPS